MQLAQVAEVEAKNYDQIHKKIALFYAFDQLMKLLLSQLINSFWKNVIAISSSSSSLINSLIFVSDRDLCLVLIEPTKPFFPPW